MNWTVYWFMLPVCITVAAIAMFTGISGAAMLVPVFLIGFPLLHAPRLSPVAAIGTALLLETAGFGTGLYRYLRLKLADKATARMLITITLPLGAIGAIASAHVPVQGLRLGYGVAMLGVAALLLHGARGQEPAHAAAPGAAYTPSVALDHKRCPEGVPRRITASTGRTFEFCAHRLRGQQVLSGIGAFFAGLISTGVGEATMPGLVRRSRYPLEVAAATSAVVVAGTVVGAALTHMVQLAERGGFSAIPWDLIVWAVPGAVVGAFIGTGLQGRISPRVMQWFFGGLFLAIGATFLLAFTVFRHRFG